ncbi:protein lifeguard 1-like isoform X3 [Bradysia coprophila]|uniref:protein lifeguard 1-like isoform X3 n=1 Tax=Bradysia coprophila TaxID=38358 RepID=UPI00187D83C7|nr:protein lifeguard 1-like isoform X3 [Bradysia coprophila]XP_037043394.1 protein lifeguard 1-like isoform X3 [Bradysia coprophila]XP_037043395.1 protein lifeguard 1-like isoform X3 [Bradysia coprophila]
MYDPNNPNQGYGGQPGYPPSGYPQPGYPQGGYPQGGFPPQQGYPPQPGYPQPGYPDSGYPQPGFQQPGYPQPGGFQQPGFVPTVPHAGPVYDPEDPEVKGFDFTDQSIRKAFIRKVYSILMVQLAITFGIMTLFVFHDGTKLWVRRHPEMMWVAFGVMLVTMISMACCTNVRRKMPMNFIFLFLFTLAQSFLLGTISARYNIYELLMAIGITAAICLALTLFAFQTKWDFTVMGGVLFVAVIVLMIFGIVAIFVPGKTITLIYASLGALIFSFYLIYDTQMMMGGKHQYSISPEEYIFAALNLYLDIVQIFMYVLMIIGATRD